MTEKLTATVEQRRSGARLIKLAGVLDEHNKLRDLMEKVPAGPALINLSGVERINSTGARDWVNWLAGLEARGTKPVLIACSPAVVAQLNRIKNFAGNAVVKSFQVPYHCAACAVDKLHLVHISELDDREGEPPDVSCDSCAAKMQLVEETTTYFAFVAQLPKYKPGTASEPVIDVPAELARGSHQGVTVDHVKQISKPRISRPNLLSRSSRPSMSAFQTPESHRKSEREIVMMTPPRQHLPRNAFWLVLIILIVTALVGTGAVMAYMLLK
jgi:anti-anti-sigma regulatory factor